MLFRSPVQPQLAAATACARAMTSDGERAPERAWEIARMQDTKRRPWQSPGHSKESAALRAENKRLCAGEGGMARMRADRA